MIKFILEFNNHSYIKNVTKHDIDTRKYTIKDLFITTIDKLYTNEFNKNIHTNTYYFIKDNKLIHPDSTILNNTILHSNTVIHIKCYRKQNGGFIGGIGDIGAMIKDGISVIFEPIVAVVETIADVFNMIYSFLKWALKFLYWCLFFAKWIFTDLLNPANFVDDFFNTLQIILMTLCSSIFNIIVHILKFLVNVVGDWTQGFWGWDQSSLTQSDRDSNYFKKMNKYNTTKCYLTNTNTIPFTIILGTVLCPPIGVFMDMGMTGWFHIFICILLTLCFYIPGLIYALLIIYL